MDTEMYWIFVLGYDLLHNELPTECDLAFEKAQKIAKDFMNSDEYKNLKVSGYDALQEYLRKEAK